MAPHIIVNCDDHDQPKPQQSLHALQQWRSPRPDSPFQFGFDHSSEHRSRSCSPQASAGTTPVLQTSSTFKPLSISPLPPPFIAQASASSCGFSASSGATTPTSGMSQRRRAPAPGTIDLSFLGLRRPSLPVNSMIESATNSPRRVSLPENVFPASLPQSSNPVPPRPPRDFPTPAALPDIATPAAGWFASCVVYGPASGLGQKPLGINSPLAPEVQPPGAPKVGCSLRVGSGSPCAFSPLPRTPLSLGLLKTDYFNILTPHAPKLGAGHGGAGFSPLPPTPSGNLTQNSTLLGVGRPRLVRSRFSSVETPGISLGEIQRTDQHSFATGEEDEKRERDEEEESAVPDETGRNGDGWAQADATRKRVLLEWETKRETIAPKPSSSSPRQQPNGPSATPVDSNRSLYQRVFGQPAPLMSPNAVFASSPLASRAVVVAEEIEKSRHDKEDVSQADEGSHDDGPSSSPPMMRSSSWTTTSHSVSPWRRTVGRRSTINMTRPKPSSHDSSPAFGVTNSENAEATGSGLRSGLFAPTAVIIDSPRSGPATPNIPRKSCPAPSLPTRSISSAKGNGAASVDKLKGQVGSALDCEQKDGHILGMKITRSRSLTGTELPDLPQHATVKGSKLTPTLWSGSTSSSMVHRNLVGPYTPPPLIPLPSPLGSCRLTTGDDASSSGMGNINPYFPLVV